MGVHIHPLLLLQLQLLLLLLLLAWRATCAPSSLAGPPLPGPGRQTAEGGRQRVHRGLQAAGTLVAGTSNDAPSSSSRLRRLDSPRARIHAAARIGAGEGSARLRFSVLSLMHIVSLSSYLLLRLACGRWHVRGLWRYAVMYAWCTMHIVWILSTTRTYYA